MALLQIIQYVCGRTNVPVPTSVMSLVSDTRILQMLRLLEEEGNDLASRGDWQSLTFEATHTTLATENQGSILTIASNGFRHIKNGTFWDRTAKLPIYGPLNDQEWQARKALTITGPRYCYRMRGWSLLSNPAPPAGSTWAFEYISKNWILGADGTTYKQYFTLDTDIIQIPEVLVIMGLRWRWKKEKGLEYAEDMRTYEMQVHDALSNSGGKAVLSMASEKYTGPGIFVPDRSWTP